MIHSPAVEENPHALLADAIRLHREGNLDAAATALEAVLARAPDEKLALLLLALIRDARDEARAAEALFRRYLALCPDDGFALHRLGGVLSRLGEDEVACAYFARVVALDPDNVRAHNDLGIVLFRLGDPERALVAFRRAATLCSTSATAHVNLAKTLAALHRPEAATAAFRSVLDLEPRSPGDWRDRGTAARELGDLAAAEAAYRRAIAGDGDGNGPVAMEARLLLAEVLEQARRTEEARHERGEFGRLEGMVRLRCLGGEPRARVLILGGAGLCNLPTAFLIDRTQFDVTTLYLPPDDGADERAAAYVADLPPVDLAFNVVGDADSGVPFFNRSEAVLGHMCCPVLNPPRCIPATRRDRLPALLTGIPGVVVPATTRMTRPEAASWADSCEVGPKNPMLIRPAGSHGGVDLVRAVTRAQCADAIAAAPSDAYYISEYHDFRAADGWYRKYRLVFVAGEIFSVHLAISTDWLVHYWRVEMADWMNREEAAFLADHRNVFLGDASTALEEVVARLGLDFGGIDCALLPDGRVLLFEANATMLVHANGASAAKRQQAIRVRDAMSRRIIFLAEQGSER